jgi:hypothetical protein
MAILPPIATRYTKRGLIPVDASVDVEHLFSGADIVPPLVVYIHRVFLRISDKEHVIWVGEGRHWRPFEVRDRTDDWRYMAQTYDVVVEVMAFCRTKFESRFLEGALVDFHQDTVMLYQKKPRPSFKYIP